MNELIRKLNEQAQDWADAHAPYASEEHEYFVEKFAQLIVQECAKSANDWYQNHDKIHSDPMSYVLAHFGVEE
jgi:hypothetical protein